MSKKDFSDRAFPSESDQYGPVLGMSLRDYFAAKAMQAMISNDRFMGRIESEPANKGIILGECMSHEAYGLADIMLAERAK